MNQRYFKFPLLVVGQQHLEIEMQTRQYGYFFLLKTSILHTVFVFDHDAYKLFESYSCCFTPVL